MIPYIYERCIIYYLKNRKNDKKELKVRTIDARTLKTLISLSALKLTFFSNFLLYFTLI